MASALRGTGNTVRGRHAVLDGEIACLRQDGSSDFRSLLFRREWPYFYAFDLLTVDGQDFRGRPLLERKRALRRMMPDYESRLRYVDHVRQRGRDLFELACEHDAEGIVAKWARGTYHVDGVTTSWFKVKNPAYTQAERRYEALRGPRFIATNTQALRRSWEMTRLCLREVIHPVSALSGSSPQRSALVQGWP